MTETKDREFGLYWVADESDSFSSDKLPARSWNVLSHYKDNYESINKSRAAGIAIQFVSPPDHIQEWEDSVERRLEESDIPNSTLEVLPANNENNNLDKFFSQFNAELVDNFEYPDLGGDEEDKDTKLTLPKSLIDTIDEVCDDAENYNLLQKARFVSNAVLAWDASVFADVQERVRTKEQLLKAHRGEDVDDPTHVFELIREGEVFEELQSVAEKEGTGPDRESIEFLKNIDPEEDVVLSKGHLVHSNTWGEDGLDIPKTNGRAGVMIAYLRGVLEDENFDGTDGFSREFFLNHIYAKMPDYDDEYVFNQYLKEYLTQGSDGNWYIYAENAPDEDSEQNEEVQKMEVAGDIRSLGMADSQNNSVKAGLKNWGGKQTVEEVKGLGSSLKDASALAQVCDLQTLEGVRDYLIKGVDKKHALRKLDSVDKQYIEEEL